MNFLINSSEWNITLAHGRDFPDFRMHNQIGALAGLPDMTGCGLRIESPASCGQVAQNGIASDALTDFHGVGIKLSVFRGNEGTPMVPR